MFVPAMENSSSIPKVESLSIAEERLSLDHPGKYT
jgi:hypothetical protein